MAAILSRADEFIAHFYRFVLLRCGIATVDLLIEAEWRIYASVN